jgi:exodeoxyribonuclease V alpha subunit
VIRPHLDDLLRRRFGVTEGLVLQLAALTVDAAVDGHAALELRDVPDLDLEAALAALSASPAVRSSTPVDPLDPASAADVASDDVRPFVLEGTRLATDRQHRAERRVVAAIARRRDGLVALPVPDTLAADHPEQRAAVATLLGPGRTRGVGVLVGGPGTGKTTTVAAVVAAAVAASGTDAVRVALAAPTGRAAARLREAVRGRRDAIAAAHGEAVAGAVADLPASTVHRLLGLRAGAARREEVAPLPYDLVVVDEASMLALPLAAELLEALAPTSQLILVGDPDQLESIETGAVLGAMVDGLGGTDDADGGAPDRVASPASPVARLRHGHRDLGAAGDRVRFAAAVRDGDVETAIAALTAAGGAAGLTWVDTDDDAPPDVREAAVLGPLLGAPGVGGLLGAAAAARDGDGTAALAALRGVRLLCAHREGPRGVAHWTARLRTRLAPVVGGGSADGFLTGEPVQVLANDRAGLLANGDVGVVVGRGADRRIVFDVADPGGAGAVIERPVALSGPLASALAVTVHRGQGSEYAQVVVVLPTADSPLATRELLYTAVTRARENAVVVGDLDAVRACVERPSVRVGALAAGLRVLADAG